MTARRARQRCAPGRERPLRGRRRGPAYLAVAALVVMASHAQDDAATTAAVSFSVGDDGRVRIEVPSAADLYHVLYYRSGPAATEYAVGIHMGVAGGLVLSEPLSVGQTGAYRVATHRRNAPADTDGDGVNDLVELARAEKSMRAPLNNAVTFPAIHGGIAIPDMATFQKLSYQGKNTWVDVHLQDLEYVKFMVYLDTPNQVYFQDSTRYTAHGEFEMGAPIPLTNNKMRGVIVRHPYLRGPSGEVGVFRVEYQPSDRFPFAKVARANELVARNMPFLRNDVVYYPMPRALSLYESEKASYGGSRVTVILAADLLGNSVLSVLNGAVGFGLLRVVGPGERPASRDIPILRHLPNSMPRVAGAISLEPQTPLSHVNLRAVQDGVPNAYIANALEDPSIAALVGKYVRFEPKTDTWSPPPDEDEDYSDTDEKRLRASYTIRKATAAEVATHHAARRPAAAQTPTRDLTVTTYWDLDDITFAGPNAPHARAYEAFGVKAVNLAAMRDFGYAAGTVPDGYALPFYFYDRFMTHNGFYADVDTLLADTDFQGSITVREAKLRALRRRIRNGAVPDWMDTKLRELQAEFPTGTAIRCRSSTNNEDLPNFSGAGLYDSYTHHPTEGHLSKSIKQVFASLWNLRAFEEREFHRVDHKTAAMGVLLHANYSGEQANGVAVSDDPFHGSTEDRFYVNAQVGEELVTNPSSAAVPEELLLGTGETFTTTLLQRSNLVADDARVLSDAHIASLQAALRTIHSGFRTLYGKPEDAEFAMEIEFKVTSTGTFAVKQARPWVY
ncbi:MAG: hypothetical protein F4Y02_00540 [Chloroflexi bacterium]|nr:hypothetical protein [Chloroflexota bacterium]